MVETATRLTSPRDPLERTNWIPASRAGRIQRPANADEPDLGESRPAHPARPANAHPTHPEKSRHSFVVRTRADQLYMAS